MYQVAHNELIASAKAVKIGKEINPEFEIGAMISHVPIYPYSCNPNDIMEAEVASRMRFFFPDVHARGYYPGYATKMFEREGFDIGWQEVMMKFYVMAKWITLDLATICQLS